MTRIESHIESAERFMRTASICICLIEENRFTKGMEIEMAFTVIKTTIRKAKHQIAMAKLYPEEY